MSGFLGSSPSAPSPSDMAARKDAMMNSVRQELALVNAQELINKVNDRCFLKCVTKPGASLSSSEQTCLSRCMDRYMEAFNIVSRTYMGRLSRERLEAQGGWYSPETDLLRNCHTTGVLHTMQYFTTLCRVRNDNFTNWTSYNSFVIVSIYMHIYQYKSVFWQL